MKWCANDTDHRIIVRVRNGIVPAEDAKERLGILELGGGGHVHEPLRPRRLERPLRRDGEVLLDVVVTLTFFHRGAASTNTSGTG